MNIYHAWCDLKPGVSDIAFSESASKYLGHLQPKGMLDQAFDHVVERSEPTEGFHFGVNSLVQNVRFALYRDFPDPQRQQGAERF